MTDNCTTRGVKNGTYYTLNVIFVIFQISFDILISFVSLSILKLM